MFFRRFMMCKKLLSYSISVVLLLVICAQVRAEVIFSDDFDHAMAEDWSKINYQGWYEQDVLGLPSPVGPWVIGSWDGYQSLPDDSGVSPTLIAINYIDATGISMGEEDGPAAWTPGYEGQVLNGVLRIASSNSGWSDTWNSGPFLYKMVEGDFVAEVEIAAADYWWYNTGGLMARAANPDGIGENENWVYLTYLPVDGVGNHMRDTISGVSTEGGITWDTPKTHLQLKRVGNTFYFSVSDDGQTWTSLPDMEEGLVRDDLPAEMQVGIFHANYTGDWVGSMDFDNFVIKTVSEAAPPENHPPLTFAGNDQVVEQDSHAGGSVVLDGSSSYDPDGDPLTFIWTWDSGYAVSESEVLTIILPLGTTTVTLVVNDGTTDSEADTVDITVQDTTVPVIHSITAIPSVLTPVNCEMVAVTVNVDASDICDPAPVCYITGVDVTDICCPESNCEDSGITAKELVDSYLKCVCKPDWELTDDPLVVLLRAKTGCCYGRVYTIHVVCEDRSGNIATGTVDVTVPGCNSK
jgi:regulation of enolase protein 1 (concanavalin A-like superfamily)